MRVTKTQGPLEEVAIDTTKASLKESDVGSFKGTFSDENSDS